MRSFWAWFGWLAAVWFAYLLQVGAETVHGGMIGCALFFACYFVTPLFRRRPAGLFALLAAAVLIAASTLELTGSETDGWIGLLHALLIFSFLTGEAVFRLPVPWMTAFGALASILLLTLALIGEGGGLQPAAFVSLYVAAFAAAMSVYRRERSENSESGARYEALLNEYRNLKRQEKTNQEEARIEERTSVARQIHDSVGHKLTALLMQLEMFRMSAQGESRDQAMQMKRLAQDSLEETRKAVKALKEKEEGGIAALLRLIRNLEAESSMQVEFSMRHGALSASLGNEQSIAVYRAIQEALTNAMRHGVSRKIEIRLETPGGSLFRFEVISATDRCEEQPIREGFGLTAMRERIEHAGGRLELRHIGSSFVVRGTFHLATAKERTP